VVKIPVLVPAVMTLTSATPAWPTSTCTFVGAAAPAAQLVVASLTAMWALTMGRGVVSRTGNAAPAQRPVGMALSEITSWFGRIAVAPCASDTTMSAVSATSNPMVVPTS
jgi:hypothetical protein